jgi:hypothetical protein
MVGDSEGCGEGGQLCFIRVNFEMFTCDCGFVRAVLRGRVQHCNEKCSQRGGDLRLVVKLVEIDPIHNVFVRGRNLS